MLTTEQRERGEGYALYHSIGLYPGKQREVEAELATFAARWCAPDNGQWIYAQDVRDEFLARWRQVIGAPEGTLTATQNVTAAFYSFMGALPAERLAGRRVLVAGDCFPSMHFLLQAMARRRNFTLDTVPLRQGESYCRDEDFIDRWDDSVAVALITWVSSTSSHKVDLDVLVAHGRAQGSLIGVDITQGVGIVPYDVNAPAIDFVIASTLKWLMGVTGAGVLYVRPEIIKECTPEFCGWFSQPDPFNWDFDKFSYADDIRRFDHGTPSVAGLAASLPGLRWQAAQGVDRLRAHNLRLSRRIITAAHDHGWTLASPEDDASRGGSVMLRLPESVPAPEVVAALRDDGFFTDHRGQILRISPGAVTTEAAIEDLCETLAGLL